MSNPNILSLNTISLLSNTAHLGTVTTTIVPAVSTNHVVQIDQFLLSNKSIANTVNAIVSFFDNSTTITVMPVSTITLAASTSLDLTGKIPVMNEGDILTASCSIVNGIDALIGYKDIS